MPADRYEEILTGDIHHEFKAVFATHDETATGVTSDIAVVRRALDAADHPAMLLIDGVSFIASMEIRFDAWGVDVAVTGSQKGFMLPAGLVIVGLSPKAMEASRSAGLTRMFFDVRSMRDSYDKNAYPYTPALWLVERVERVLPDASGRGAGKRLSRHRRIAKGVRAAVKAWNLDLCARSPELHSDSVTVICTPEGFNATDIVTNAADVYEVTFGVGLGEVAGRVFRIGHLGNVTDVMALSGIATAEMCMADLGLDVPLGSGVAAAQEYYRTHRPSSGV